MFPFLENFDSSYQNGAVCQGSSGPISEEDFEQSIPIITDASKSTRYGLYTARSDLGKSLVTSSFLTTAMSLN